MDKKIEGCDKIKNKKIEIENTYEQMCEEDERTLFLKANEKEEELRQLEKELIKLAIEYSIPHFIINKKLQKDQECLNYINSEKYTVKCALPCLCDLGGEREVYFLPYAKIIHRYNDLTGNREKKVVELEFSAGKRVKFIDYINYNDSEKESWGHFKL